MVILSEIPPKRDEPGLLRMALFYGGFRPISQAQFCVVILLSFAVRVAVKSIPPKKVG
jgi:hypothetical protein